MVVFPVFLKLTGRDVLVVGGGSVAEARVEQLLEAQAVLQVIAPQVTPRLAEFANQGRIRWLHRRFHPGDEQGKGLVFAATGRHDVDRLVSVQCQRSGVLCNAIDDPEHCDFYAAALLRRGDLQIAISTNGQSPGLAQQIRRQLEKQFDQSWGERLQVLGCARRKILARVPPGESRQQLLRGLVRKEFRAKRETR